MSSPLTQKWSTNTSSHSVVAVVVVAVDVVGVVAVVAAAVFIGVQGEV